MDCVRPGLELVLAILVPSRELMRLDLPTLERPRNATSGSAGAGKWAGSVAEGMNRDNTRTTQFRMSRWKLQASFGPKTQTDHEGTKAHEAKRAKPIKKKINN